MSDVHEESVGSIAGVELSFAVNTRRVWGALLVWSCHLQFVVLVEVHSSF